MRSIPRIGTRCRSRTMSRRGRRRRGARRRWRRWRGQRRRAVARARALYDGSRRANRKSIEKNGGRSISWFVGMGWGQGVCQCIPLTPLYTPAQLIRSALVFTITVTDPLVLFCHCTRTAYSRSSLGRYRITIATTSTSHTHSTFPSYYRVASSLSCRRFSTRGAPSVGVLKTCILRRCRFDAV